MIFALYRSAAALALATLATTSALAQETRAGATLPEWGKFGIQTQYIDKAAAPGDDFDRHVNGKWNDTAEMPADKARIGAFSVLSDLSEERLRKILDELTKGKHRPGSAKQRVADAYRAFTDTKAIDAAGLAPAKPWLDRIAAVKTREQLVDLFAVAGFASPVGIEIDADEKQSDLYALYLYQDGLGLPDRDYYLVDSERNRTIRAKYLELATFQLEKAGHADPRAGAQAVLDLETAMAKTMWDRTVLRNRDLTYNRLSPAQLDALAPGGRLAQFLERSGIARSTFGIVRQLPPTDDEITKAKLTSEVLAKMGGGLPAGLRLIDEVPLETWKAWLTTHFLTSFASYLPKELDDARFAFYGTVLSGQQQQRPRWKRGIDAVHGQLGEQMGLIYAERYFPAPNKKAMTALVANLRKAMAANLAELKWMGPETRAEAMAKLNSFTPKIGAPDRFKTYDGLKISATTPLANQVAAVKWTQDFLTARIGKPVDRSEWFLLPQTVNAYYNPTFNEIVFPAAILQPPFFNLTADPAVNYGGIGAVIGHEMGHGFDDQGAKSDAKGNLRDWWKPADKANFDALTSRLVEQYNGFCPLDEGKTCVNGTLTLGENIGDLGGLSLAYRAYRMSLGKKQAPIIDGTTGDQRFFMAWAQVWRSKYREAESRRLLTIDPHSPPQYRINGVVRNFDEWYRAFAVKPGDKLYLPPAERVRIW